MPAVLITGANRGLGLEFARHYAGAGWRVFAACRASSPALDELAVSNQVERHILDVAEAAEVARLAHVLADETLEVLLNNAGYFGRVGFAEGGIQDQAFGAVDYDDWLEVLRVNLLGPMRMAEAFLPQLKRGDRPRIVTLTSMVGSMGLNTSGGLYAYRTSKAAVNALMHSMSIDLRQQGVLAIAMHPGWASTDMGGANAEIEPAEAVRSAVRVIDRLSEEQLGQVISYTGDALPY